MQWFLDNSSNIWNPGCCCVCFSGVSLAEFQLRSQSGSQSGESAKRTWSCMCIEADEIDDGIIVRDYFHDTAPVATLGPTTTDEAVSPETRIDILNHEESTRKQQHCKRTLVLLILIAAVIVFVVMNIVPMIISVPVAMVVCFCLFAYMFIRGSMGRRIPLMLDHRRLIPLNRHIANIVCEFAHLDPVLVVMSRPL